MVLELLIYAKSAMKNFDQWEASFESHMTTMEASDWSKFYLIFWKKFWIFFVPPKKGPFWAILGVPMVPTNYPG